MAACVFMILCFIAATMTRIGIRKNLMKVKVKVRKMVAMRRIRKILPNQKPIAVSQGKSYKMRLIVLFYGTPEQVSSKHNTRSSFVELKSPCKLQAPYYVYIFDLKLVVSIKMYVLLVNCSRKMMLEPSASRPVLVENNKRKRSAAEQ